ncbi:hypothetical protein [Paenibacillus dendritiformis]|uniref:Lipoprotein n=1 Tax=Paenibacillus dendritiformis C454 TaxID=1131935 RepID=H3SN28_9BACL|nr:hypothetical protein [Paenibacillus dendritiformis]EHQ59513.1 hypothetical protein PDENDC454_24879 [Paenibacillus dendritiformis C454]CAH8770841.1 hypothetical protein H7S4_003576 [Paenibacillus dendritiformis]
MNKLSILIVSAAFMILTTGCVGFYDTVEKDIVMVKKVSKNKISNEVKYEEVLSQDTAKTLSLNAVNKYFDTQLSRDDVQIELMEIDQKNLKGLVEHGINQRLSQQEREDFETELEKTPGGLFYLTLTVSSKRNEVYNIVLNARNGDVLNIYKLNLDRNKSIDGSRFIEQIIKTANKFIQEKENYNLSDLTMDFRTILSDTAEVYYWSKNNQLKYHVIVHLEEMQVIGFNKDILAMLKYYTGLTNYQYWQDYRN